MSDSASSPTDTDKIADILSMIAAKGDEQKDALIELADQTRETKTILADVMTQRTEVAAHVKDLKASIDTTRRALDPEQLGKHVADNIDQFMGETSKLVVKGTTATVTAAQTSQHVLEQTKETANLAITAQESLAGIATRLEERDKRSKWDWVTLGCAMIVTAALAAAAGYFFAKDQIRANDFDRSVRLIAQDDDTYWCGQADGQVINSQSGSKFCAIHMPNYVVPEQTE